MKAITCGALMALTTTAATAAEEDLNSANFILPYCRLTETELLMAKPPEALFHGHCFGVVTGVRLTLDAMRTAQVLGTAKLDPVLCAAIPDNAPIQRLINVVVRYAETHPEQMRESLGKLAIIAFHQAWPCRKVSP